MTVRAIWRGGASLGEGPVWDADAGVLWFVDIKKRHVHRLDPDTQTVRSWDAPGQVGWVLPADDGVLLAGLQTGLCRFDPRTGAFDQIAPVEADRPGNRLNDATVAPDGSVWFGSMDDGETQRTGRIYRWNGHDVADSGLDPVCITNGPAIAPDGRTLYHVDTMGGIVHAVELGADGTLGDARVFARIDPADGHPDGVTTDANGNVWLGLWGGWRARLYDPDGAILTEVRLPVANVTKIALGGPDLRTAFATTASVGLSEQECADQPDAGALFAFDVEVPGHRVPRAVVGRR